MSSGGGGIDLSFLLQKSFRICATALCWSHVGKQTIYPVHPDLPCPWEIESSSQKTWIRGHYLVTSFFLLSHFLEIKFPEFWILVTKLCSSCLASIVAPVPVPKERATLQCSGLPSILHRGVIFSILHKGGGGHVLQTPKGSGSCSQFSRRGHRLHSPQGHFLQTLIRVDVAPTLSLHWFLILMDLANLEALFLLKCMTVPFKVYTPFVEEFVQEYPDSK